MFNLDLQKDKKQGFGGWLAWNFQYRLKFSILEGDLELFQSEKDQGQTPWVDSACADCPGFWSWVPLLPQLPPSSWSLRLFPCASILLHGPVDIYLDLLSAAPLPPVQKQDAQHMFLQHRGAHAEKSHPILNGGPQALQKQGWKIRKRNSLGSF